MRHMIIGGDSFIGSAVANNLKKQGGSVIITSRKQNELSEGSIYLDLSSDISSWEIPKDVDFALFCAAITSIEKCRTHPDETRFINVQNTINLSLKLMEKGIFVIFPSTNLVFDGQSPYNKVNDPVCPCVEYGRQKADVEKKLLQFDQHIAVVRLTKILSPQTHLIRTWVRQLKSREVIHPFSDMVLSPIPIHFVVQAIIRIAEEKRPGIWHISGTEDITYEQLALHIAQKIGVGDQYVQPIKTKDSGIEFEHIPKYTTLDTSRIEDELGITPLNLYDTIDSILI